MTKLIWGGVKEVAWPLIGWFLGFAFVYLTAPMFGISLNTKWWIAELCIPVVFILIGIMIYKKK